VPFRPCGSGPVRELSDGHSCEYPPFHGLLSGSGPEDPCPGATAFGLPDGRGAGVGDECVPIGEGDGTGSLSHLEAQWQMTEWAAEWSQASV